MFNYKTKLSILLVNSMHSFEWQNLRTLPNFKIHSVLHYVQKVACTAYILTFFLTFCFRLWLEGLLLDKFDVCERHLAIVDSIEWEERNRFVNKRRRRIELRCTWNGKSKERTSQINSDQSILEEQ